MSEPRDARVVRAKGDKQHHVNSPQPIRYVKTRHPDEYPEKEQAATYPMTVCSCDNKDNHADERAYVFENFTSDMEQPSVAGPATWADSDNGWTYSNTITYDGAYTPTEVLWSGVQTGPPVGNTNVEHTVGTQSRQWTTPWPGGDCGLSPSWVGGAWRESWHKFIVPAHPANASGFEFQVPGFYEVDGSLFKQYGVTVVARDSVPTAREQGVKFATVPGSKIGGAYLSLICPIGLIPPEGGELWIGVQPTPLPTGPWGVPVTGPVYCGFNTPENLNIAGSGEVLVNRWRLYAVGWRTADPDGVFGYGDDAEAQGASFAGRLPWKLDVNEGVCETIGGALRFQPPASGGGMTMRMEGVALADMDEAQDDGGEPWDHPDGVRFLVRFKLSSIVEGTGLGLTMRWNDGNGWVTGVAAFETPTILPSMTVSVDGNSDVVEGAQMVAGEWQCAWVDTRMNTKVVGRLWEEADSTVMWSGEKSEKAMADRDVTYDGHEVDNAFELVIEAGPEQEVVVDRIEVIGPATDGQVAHEHLGSGDGQRVSFWTSEPYRRGTVNPFRVAGVPCRVLEIEPQSGRFSSVDGLPAPLYGRMDITYIVDREDQSDVEDAYADDTGDDPDT